MDNQFPDGEEVLALHFSRGAPELKWTQPDQIMKNEVNKMFKTQRICANKILTY